MAGAGYKLFNTGDVLTAAQVNTYLMEQTVMVFADAAARTTALTGVVAEGMLSYLKSTKQVEVYNGSAWVASDDPNAIQNSIVDAKGDLITATANDTPARLAVGSDGETIVADSASSTGLRWQPTGTGNYLINSGFDWWQRGTSFTSGYTADRWSIFASANATVSQETSTIQDGSTYSLKVTSTSNTSYANIGQAFESQVVNELCGRTITVSAYVRANATFNSSVRLQFSTNTTANTMTGGTWTTASFTDATPTTTGWTRMSATYTVPSGTKGLRVELNYNAVVPNGSILYWSQAQVEVGSVASAWKRAGGTLAGELAACQRYYWRLIDGSLTNQMICNAYAYTTTDCRGLVQYPVTMRVAPTLVQTSGTNYFNFQAATGDSFDSLLMTQASTTNCLLYAQSAQGVNGLVAGQGGSIFTLSTSASLAFSSEL